MPPKRIPRVKVAPKSKLPKPFECGTILKDSKSQKWVLDNAIGQGGFGLVYQAHAENNGHKMDYVVKIEPKDSGPLFCEMHYYIRAGSVDNIKNWQLERKFSHVGVPHLISYGSHERNGKENFRFLVLPKLGTDLHKYWEKCDKKFSVARTADFASQIVTALEYIHSSGYVHADVKAGNILSCPNNSKLVYLVDFGLAAKYRDSAGVHRSYKEDPKRKHDGTTEYCSRDAHRGVPCSRRSDLETLVYCMLEWMTGSLPWNLYRDNADKVAQEKQRLTKNPRDLLEACKLSVFSPHIIPFMQKVFKLEYEEEPNYQTLRTLLSKISKSELTNGHQEAGPSGRKRYSDTPAETPPNKSCRKTPVAVAKVSKNNCAVVQPVVKRGGTGRGTPRGGSRGRGRGGRGRTVSPIKSPKSPRLKARAAAAGNSSSPNLSRD